MYTCTKVISLVRKCRARGFGASSLCQVYHPDRASPLPYHGDEASGLAGSAQPGPQLSPPTQLPRPESQAAQSEGPLETLERVTVRGEGNTWPGANLLCILSLSNSVNHSVTTSHTLPPPLVTCSSFILKLTDPVLHTLPHAPVVRHVSPLSPPTAVQLALHAQFKKVYYMKINTLLMHYSMEISRENKQSKETGANFHHFNVFFLRNLRTHPTFMHEIHCCFLENNL